MTTYIVYEGVRRLSLYLNWARRNLGAAMTIPESALPIEVQLESLVPEQRQFLDDLLAKTGGLRDVVVAPDDPAEVELPVDTAIACAVGASQQVWPIGGTPRVEWALEYPRCWAVSNWYLPNIPPGHGYIVDKASRRCFEQRYVDIAELHRGHGERPSSL